MSPNEFLKLAGVKGKEEMHEIMKIPSILNIIEGVKKGNFLDTGFLDYSEGKIKDHEGRNRAIAAIIMEVKRIPVAIIGNEHKKFSLEETKPQEYKSKENLNSLVL